MEITPNPNATSMTAQAQLETTATLANAILLTKLIFLNVSGREISNLDHHESDVDDLIAASINKHIASR